MAEEHRFYCVQTSEWQLPESISNLISASGFKWNKPGLATVNSPFPHLLRLKYRTYEFYWIQFNAKGIVLLKGQVLWMWGFNSQRLLINKCVCDYKSLKMSCYFFSFSLDWFQQWDVSSLLPCSPWLCCSACWWQ